MWLISDGNNLEKNGYLSCRKCWLFQLFIAKFRYFYSSKRGRNLTKRHHVKNIIKNERRVFFSKLVSLRGKKKIYNFVW